MRTIIIIGASNVTLALPLIWSTLTKSLSEPFRLLIAAGHGRSFGMPNTVLGRTLPSIQECGLWKLLDEQPSDTSPQVLITDVGNDLLYGADSGQTLQWVHQTVQRLETHAADIALTELPRCSLETLSRKRFHFFRSILFPQSRLTYDAALSQSEQLNHGLTELAQRRERRCFSPEAHWYGFDPIHVRRRYRPEAWSRYLSHLIDDLQVCRPRRGETWRIWNLKAEQRWVRSRRLTSPQPASTTDAAELWLF